MRRPNIIPEQYTLLDTFSDDSPETANSIFKMLLSDNISIYSPTSVQNGVLNDTEYFKITNIGNQLKIAKGICLINSILIQTTSEVYLNVGITNSCLFTEDIVPTMNANYIVTVGMYYNPTIETPNAVIGLIYSNGAYIQYKDNLIILGFVKFSIENGIFTVESIIYEDESRGLLRSIPLSVIDGGVINDPDLITI